MKRILLATLALSQLACTSPCSSVCDKLLSCEALDASPIGEKECDLDCAVQESSYDDDEALSGAFEAYKDCVMDKSCEEIAAGDCYNPDLYAF